MTFEALFCIILISYLLILIWYFLNCFRHEARGILHKGCIHKSDWQVARSLAAGRQDLPSWPRRDLSHVFQKGGQRGLCPAKNAEPCVPPSCHPSWNHQTESSGFDENPMGIFGWLADQTRSRLILQSLDRILPKATPKKTVSEPFNGDAFTFQQNRNPSAEPPFLFSSPDLQKLLVHPRERAPCSCGTCWIGCTPFFAPQICLEKTWPWE